MPTVDTDAQTPRRWVVHVRTAYQRDPTAGSVVIVHAPDRQSAAKIAARAGHLVRQVVDIQEIKP